MWRLLSWTGFSLIWRLCSSSLSTEAHSEVIYSYLHRPVINANTPKSFYVLPLHNKYHHAFIFQEKGGFVLRQQSVGVRPAQGGHDGPPLLSLPSLPAAGQSLMEGASQITGTNDSTFHQLQQPHPSHAEGPVSPRPSLTIPRKEHIKATPSTVWARTSSTCLVRVGNPARERFAVKKPVRHSFGVLVVFTWK